MKDTKIFAKDIQKKLPVVNYENKKVISYSQYSTYAKCPKEWELKHIHKHKIDDPSIHIIFGNAMHSVFQHLLYLYYKVGVKQAEAFDYKEMLRSELKNGYEELKKKSGKHFSTSKELAEFYNDGISIIEFFKKKRNLYFNTRKYELIGIEIPLFIPLIEGVDNSLYFIGYIDFAIRCKEDNEVTVFDIKTSTSGWNDYKKKDSLTTSQLVLYKKYFSEQYKIDLDKIKVQYFIVKRKIREDLEFPQKRIQEYVPPSGKVTINKVTQGIENFINTAFEKDTTEFNTKNFYPPLAGINYSNCKFCIFNNREDLCPKEKRICN